jgi:hypothetical protein
MSHGWAVENGGKSKSLMPFVPAGADHAAQVKALVEQHFGLALRALVGFFFPD